MARILIIQGHPDTDQNHLCHAIADAYQDGAIESGHAVDTITVANQDISFLRSKAEWEDGDLPAFATEDQSKIRDCNHMVLIYPLWMGDIPAILKAWIEHVFRKGFAFEMGKNDWHGALKGKSARVIVTMGMPSLVYRWFFVAHSVRSLDRNILKFCGIRPVRWSIFGNAEDPSGDAQQKFLDTARTLGRNAV